VPTRLTTRKPRIFGPATGGAMTTYGGGATEYYNASGAEGNPIQDRLARDGKLQAGSPVIIPAPGGQPGVRPRHDNDSGATGGIETGTVPTTAPSSGGGSGGVGGGGGFGGGGGPRRQ
jgi:hypothetical protein